VILANDTPVTMHNTMRPSPSKLRRRKAEAQLKKIITLSLFSLLLLVKPSLATLYEWNGSLSITDYNTTITTINITDTYTIDDVDVKIDLVHTYDNDLDIWLVSPAGTVELSTDNGRRRNNYSNTWFDDEAAVSITRGRAPFAGIYRPEGLLSDLDGYSVYGNWELQIYDDCFWDSGTLYSFALEITGDSSQPVPEPCTMLLVGSGLLGLAGFRKKIRKK